MNVQLAIDIPKLPLPSSLVFDKAWRNQCSIRQTSITSVASFTRAHYLHKPPAVVVLCLSMFCSNQPVGCVIFAEPPKEVYIRFGGVTWELARLFIEDNIPKNAETWLIAQSIRWIKRYHSDVLMLVSYADPSQGHKGTIYKAANWKADGYTDMERQTPRSDYYDRRTGIKYGRKGNMPINAIIEKRPRQPKWRFIYNLKH